MAQAGGGRSLRRRSLLLENAVHAWVCQGISFGTAEKKIATNWSALYKQIFGAGPS